MKRSYMLISNSDYFFYHIFYYKEKCRCNLLIYNGIMIISVGVRRLELPAPTSRT